MSASDDDVLRTVRDTCTKFHWSI